jgi:zinc protease
VFGGGFNARVNMNLREKHGYTYGAFSNMDIRRGGSAWYISSAVRTDATDSAVVEAVGEYRRIIAEAVPNDELAGATNNVVASFPSSVQSAQELQNRIQQLVIWGLPLDFWGSYRERLASVSSADVQRVARTKLTPDALTIVVVGDLSKIEKPIRARNLGTVEVWNAEGAKLSAR